MEDIGVEKDERKYKDYFAIIEKDFYSAIIYYTLALGTEEKYEQMIKELLGYEKEIVDLLFGNFPKDHIAVKYYDKVKCLKDDQYNCFIDIVKSKFLNFFEKNSYNVLFDLTSEEEVDTLVRTIILGK